MDSALQVERRLPTQDEFWLYHVIDSWLYSMIDDPKVFIVFYSSTNTESQVRLSVILHLSRQPPD